MPISAYKHKIIIMKSIQPNQNEIIILCTRKCRKSNLVIKFLEDEQIPHIVKSLETDEDAQRLASELNILSSPGIIVNGKLVYPQQLIEDCQIQDQAKKKKLLENLMNE